MKTIFKSVAVIFFTAFVVAACQTLVNSETSFAPHASAKLPALDQSEVLGSSINLHE